MFCRYALWVRVIYIAYLKNNIEHKAGNTPEHEPKPSCAEPKPSCAEPAWHASVDATPRWGKQAQLGSLIDRIHRLLVHQSEPPPSHSELEVRMWDSRSYSPIYFCSDEASQANLSWLGMPQLGFALRCIPSLRKLKRARN